MLDGKWTLKNYSAFMALNDGEKLPSYNDGDVVWEFSGNSVIITKKNPNEKNDFSMSAGDYPLWKRKYMLAVSDKTYMFTIENDGRLVLDSNTDPRLSSDGPVLYFKRMK